MPTPSADYQASLRGLLMGAGTPYLFGVGGIDGLGNPSAKTADVQLDGRNGEYASPDYLDVRPLLLHLEIVKDTDEDAFTALELLNAAWLPSTSNINLHIQLPGIGHVYYIGRPRSLEADCTEAPSGHISCIGEFVAMFPTAQAP